eukprot:gene10154-biopygen1740
MPFRLPAVPSARVATNSSILLRNLSPNSAGVQNMQNPGCVFLEKRQRTRTGRGPHDRIQRNGRGAEHGPDADSAVSPTTGASRAAAPRPPPPCCRGPRAGTSRPRRERRVLSPDEDQGRFSGIPPEQTEARQKGTGTFSAFINPAGDHTRRYAGPGGGGRRAETPSKSRKCDFVEVLRTGFDIQKITFGAQVARG